MPRNLPSSGKKKEEKIIAPMVENLSIVFYILDYSSLSSSFFLLILCPSLACFAAYFYTEFCNLGALIIASLT